MTVRLREVIASDLPIHFEQQRDPASSAMAVLPPRDRAAFDAHWAKILADPAVVVRTVLHDGQVAGSAVSFMRGGQREVGYWIARERWGKGVATAALRLLLEEVTDRPLFARVAVANIGSLHVLAKCGFETVAEAREDDVRIRTLRLTAPA
jgi:RimJ/RimL family protein N-acetyltransferase